MSNFNKKTVGLFLVIVSFFLTTNVYADDYPDDIYDGDYSIEEMLENYNVVTFGKKELDSKMSQNVVRTVYGNYGNIQPVYLLKGDAAIFHVNSQFLINGTLHRRRIDLKKNNDSLKSSLISMSSFFLGNPSEYKPDFCGYDFGQWYGAAGCYNRNDSIYSINGGSYYVNLNSSLTNFVVGNYMNYDRLKDSIQTKQNRIKRGRAIVSQDRVAHVKTGGEYFISDINEIDSILFDDFADNKDKLTIITINNTGDIKFPKIYESMDNGEGSLVSTNDYYGMNRPDSNYAEYYVIDRYYGNIIWNIPNATYIELPSAPFIGHVIAPNADLYGPELHYAGAFLVNSLYLEGNSEAHFYPLTITDIPYQSNMESVKAKTNLKKSQGSIKFYHNLDPNDLGEGTVVSFKVEAEKNYLLSGMVIKDEEGNPVEYKEIGDGEYEFTMPATDVVITPQFKEKNLINTLTNPKTGRNFLIIFGVIGIISFISYKKYKKEKSKLV